MEYNIWNIILIVGAIFASIFIINNIINIISNIIDGNKNNSKFRELESKSCKIHSWANHMDIKFCTDCGKVFGKDGYLPEIERKAATTVAKARSDFDKENKGFRIKLAAEYNLTETQFNKMLDKYAKFKVDFQVNLINKLNQKK